MLSVIQIGPAIQQAYRGLLHMLGRGNSLAVAAFIGAAGVALLALLALLHPRVETLTSSNLSLATVLVFCTSTVGALSALHSFRVGREIRNVANDIRTKSESDNICGSLESNRGGQRLKSLIANIDDLLARIGNERHQALEAITSNRILARDMQRLFQLIDSINDGLIVIDSASKIILANSASSPFLSVSPSDARGQLARDCICQPEVLNLLDPETDEGPFHVISTVEIPPNEEAGTGDVAVFQCQGRAENGEALGQVLVLRDISRIKDVERQQSEFVDSVAHELRTPLTSILAYVELLIDDQAEDPQSKYDFYNIIYEESHRLSQLIDNLLNISMMEMGTAELTATPTRLKRLLEENLDVIKPQCQKKNVSLVIDLPDRLPTLDIDKQLFGVALMNILSNAAKYTPENGSIFVTTESGEEEFIVKVRNSGEGISEEELPRIFDKFFRSSAAKSGDVQGSGIGLSTALQIMRMHSGDIRVRSTPEEGTQFSIVLPRTAINAAIGE